MPNKNDLTDLLNDKLSSYLNKTVNVNLTRSVVKKFKASNNRSSFLQYLSIIGLSDESKAEDIYTLINSNIGLIESLLEEKGSKNTSSTGNDIKRPIKRAKETKLSLSFDDDDDDDDIIPEPNSRIGQKFTHDALSAQLDDSIDSALNNAPKAPKKAFTFKKISKADALNIKSDVPSPSSTIESVKSKEPEEKAQKSPEKKKLTLNELARLERQNQDISKNEEADLMQYSETLLDDDKDWYMADDLGNAATVEFEDFEYQETSTTSKPTYRKRQVSNESGGMFDETTGEYIDFDHNQNDDENYIAKIDISYSFNIPPFLDKSKEDLVLQMGEGAKSFKIGSTVNPIKDSTSELAVAAREGSYVVKERKTKRERAKQAEERSNISGTAMGNVIGVQDKNEQLPLEISSHGDTDDGLSNNPDTQNLSSDIRAQRTKLPAFAVKSDLVRIIMENQVTVVIGETGSGKTTQLAQFLNEEGLGKNLKKNGIRKMIACTQPRRVAAMSVAKRVSEEMGCTLGNEVGYSIRFEDKTDPNTTLIKYMTDGILLREFLTDPMLENYSCIIMDEAHERSLNTDVLLGLFKQLLRRRKDIRLVVTSATMNADKFTRFFGDAPRFFIPGRTFPVDVFFSKSACQDYVETAVKQVLTIHLQSGGNSNDGDILVFMTGQEDIEVTCELLREKLNLLDSPPPLDILPIYSTLPAELQKKIFRKKDRNIRKVVVATNIAETSLTIDGIKYVVDTGLVKLKVYNPKLGMDTLQSIPISLANAEQRTGRAGRSGPGITYRLYTERASSERFMYKQPIPEIQRANLSNVMLLLKSLKVKDISSFSFLDSPPKDLLSYSLYDLWTLGALDNLGDLTDLGQQMCRFPMEPTLSKLICLSCQSAFHCSEEILTIVAMLSVPSVYMRPKERAKEADSKREKFAIPESDHLTLLNVYNQWEVNARKLRYNFDRISIWCSKNFLNIKSLLRARDIRSQLTTIISKARMPLLKSKSDEDVRRCLCASLFHQSAKTTKISAYGQAEFTNLRHSYMRMYLHPTSCLNGANVMSQYVVFHELVLTTKEYMNCVTCVDPLWLISYGYKFFSALSDQVKLLETPELPIRDMASFQRSLDEDRVRYYELMAKRDAGDVSTNANQMQVSSSRFKRRRGF